jgi:hypothetical protein
MGVNESTSAQIHRCSTSPKEYSKKYQILGTVRGVLQMKIQGQRIPAKVDREMRSLLWVLILEGCKHVIGTLASGTSSLLAIIEGPIRQTREGGSEWDR